MHNAMFGNAETLRTQSIRMRISSALSASPRFKSSRAEIAKHGYVLTPGPLRRRRRGGRRRHERARKRTPKVPITVSQGEEKTYSRSAIQELTEIPEGWVSPPYATIRWQTESSLTNPEGDDA